MRVRSGIALFAALALMIVIGLLAAGAFAAAELSQRSLRMARTDAVLTASANYGLSTVLSDPVTYGLADLPLGRARRLAVTIPDTPPASVTVSVTRLPAGVLWLVATAAYPWPDTGQRRFNMVARFPSVGAAPPAAIVSRGDVRAGHDVVLLRDTTVDSECDRPVGPDFVVAPGAIVNWSSPSTDSLHVTVSPAAADSAAYYQTAFQLGRLDSSSRIVRVRADTTIVGGTFDGILLVDGSLTIAGAFRATGLIVVRGHVSAIAGGFSLNGSLVSFASDGARPAVDVAAATLLYSPCGVSRAFRVALPPRPVRKRSWSEMF